MRRQRIRNIFVTNNLQFVNKIIWIKLTIKQYYNLFHWELLNIFKSIIEAHSLFTKRLVYFIWLVKSRVFLFLSVFLSIFPSLVPYPTFLVARNISDYHNWIMTLFRYSCVWLWLLKTVRTWTSYCIFLNLIFYYSVRWK